MSSQSIKSGRGRTNVIRCWAPSCLPPKRAPNFRVGRCRPNSGTLFDRDAKLTRFATGFGFTEGPVWDRGGFSTSATKNRTRSIVFTPTEEKRLLVELGDPDGNTFDGRQHRCSIVRACCAPLSGSRPMANTPCWPTPIEGKRLNSPNDVVLGPDKRHLLHRSRARFPKGEKQEIRFQGVYRLGTNGNVRLLVKECRSPMDWLFRPKASGSMWMTASRRTFACSMFSRRALIN